LSYSKSGRCSIYGRYSRACLILKLSVILYLGAILEIVCLILKLGVVLEMGAIFETVLFLKTGRCSISGRYSRACLILKLGVVLYLGAVLELVVFLNWALFYIWALF
jgi:hypothetical protein